MPVKSLNSSVQKWPARTQVERALRAWSREAAKQHPELLRLGYFGSYARGDWGVGSDLDLIAVVSQSPEPFERRARTWNSEVLPVPAELLIYTAEEWRKMEREGSRFARTLAQEVVWVYPDAQ